MAGKNRRLTKQTRTTRLYPAGAIGNGASGVRKTGAKLQRSMFVFRIASTLVLAAALLGPGQHLGGTFALIDARAHSQAYLAAQRMPGDALIQRLDFWFARGLAAAPIESFDLDMTKLLHVVIVSDDFKTFLHVHPRFTSDGHFRIEQRFPRPATYYVYADGQPHGLGEQVFRFALRVGDESAVPAQIRLAPTGKTSHAGPYDVTLDRTTLRAGAPSALIVHIRRDGKAARDLRPYLGALAHAVFIDTQDLRYLHVHPMSLSDANRTMPDMGAMPALPDRPGSAPDMLLRVSVAEAGTYKLWLQFRGGGTLRVAPFVLTAS